MDEWTWAKGAPAGKRPLLWKIRRLCIEHCIPRGGQVRYAEGVARRQHGVERSLHMMDQGELYVLVGALNRTVQHQKQKAAKL